MKKQPFKIVIDKNGNISSVYSEKLDFSEIGEPYINRATEVKFNNRYKHWTVIALPPYFPKRSTLAEGFKLRSEAISWEVDFLNTNMEKILNESKTLNSTG